jgi:hypothetical protein
MILLPGDIHFQTVAQPSVHPIPDKVRRSLDGGTAARRDCVRVFGEFSWLEVGSGKAALLPPTHQRVTQAVGRQTFTAVNVNSLKGVLELASILKEHQEVLVLH